MTVRVFCEFAIELVDEKGETQGLIESHGIWREFASLVPIGTSVWFQCPQNWGGDSFCLHIANYHVMENGDIVAGMLENEDEYYFTVRGVLDEVLQDMASIGFVRAK